MDNRFYNSNRSVLTGSLKTTRQLNKRQKDILGFIYSQAECTHASVYREHGCIAISSVSLGQACRPAVSDKIALSIAYELEKAGFIKIKRAEKGEKGVANRYTLTDQFFEWMKVTNDEFKKDVDMDQDSELNRQIQSLQAENGELRLQLEELKKAKAPEASDKDKRIAELEARLKNAIKWWNANKGVFEKVKALQAALEESKRNEAAAENKASESHRKEIAAVKQSAIDRSKANKLQEVFNRLVYQGVIDKNGNPVGNGMVTVEPEEPYRLPKPDELLHEISTVIRNRN